MSIGRLLLAFGLGAVLLTGCRDSGGDPISRQQLLAATGPTFDHAAWGKLLADHVDSLGGVDYAGMKADQPALDGYLGSLAEVDVPKLGRAEQLAFWIDAYNAFTVASILEKYPDIKSVNDVSDVFKRKTHRVAGQLMSLNNIEGMARAAADPRVHFAVNCASISCPKLLNRPYVGEKLNDQLDASARAYVQSAEGVRVKDDGSLAVSSIFKWYSSDFQHAGEGANALQRAFGFIGGLRSPVSFVRPYMTEAAGARFDDNADVSAQDYNWSLNTTEAMAAGRQGR